MIVPLRFVTFVIFTWEHVHYPPVLEQSLPTWFNDFPARNLHFDRPFRSHPHTQLTCLKPINHENKLGHKTLNHENKLRHKLVTYHFYRLNFKTKTCKWKTQCHISPIVKAIYSTTSEKLGMVFYWVYLALMSIHRHYPIVPIQKMGSIISMKWNPVSYGNLTVCYGNSPFKIVFFNISMSYRYHSYVKLPGKWRDLPRFIPWSSKFHSMRSSIHFDGKSLVI